MLILFLLIALLTVVSALGVVVFRNPLQSALSLIAHFVLLAGVYAMLDAHFLAAVQIVVYAGAIMVLVLFVVMLLNVKVEQVKPIGKIYWMIGSATVAGFLMILIPVLAITFRIVPDQVESLVGGAHEIGRLLYTDYLYPFEVASVLIFVAITGAVMIAKRDHGAMDLKKLQEPKSGGPQ